MMVLLDGFTSVLLNQRERLINELPHNYSITLELFGCLHIASQVLQP